MAEIKYVSQQNLSAVLTKIKATFVAKETGKSLISDELITKLNGIAAGAQVNVIEKVSVNGVEQSVTEKGVNITVPTKHSDLGAVAESDLTAELAAKVNAAAEGNHSHANKTELDKIADGDKAKWDAAAAKAHEHANKAELDLIASGDKAKWDKAVSDLAAVVADYLKTSDKEALEALIEALDGRVTVNENGIATLNGNASVEGSVDKKIADAINAWAATVTDDGKINTYKEAMDYIAAHGSEYTALLGKVTANENAIATLNGDASTAGSVAKAVADEAAIARAAEKANADAAAAAQKTADDIAVDYVKASEMVAMTTEEIEAAWNAA